ncbi:MULTISPECIES: VasL domain-containing protein [unclassified Raoultella]|uniref:VasL domain-containing protein n=1 Tax=unclassified Raoultella TaxID=2627600 RepID=UPI00135AE730|nr:MULTISPECIES: VasL domain-containing protein [unclassified Raoultella]
MKSTEPRDIRTGGDPRPFPDFIALRDEMSKQTHPARPDIRWERVEKLSLALFDKNGIELQTGAWYTLARSHLARVEGMNEGLKLVATMLSRQWVQYWPRASHPRAEILSGLFQRLQKVFRTFTLSHEDYHELLQLESTLDSLSSILARQELLQISQIEPLVQQVCSAVTRVENAPEPQLSAAPIILPAAQVPPIGLNESTPEPRRPDAIPPGSAVAVNRNHKTAPAPNRVGLFACGMLTAFALGAAVFIGGHYLARSDQAGQQPDSSQQPLPWLPGAAAGESGSSSGSASGWLKDASLRLEALSALPPDWHLRYGQDLINQAYALWPGLPGTEELGTQWRQKLALNGTPDDSLAGWHQGMHRLQSLSEQLNALDGQKGRYLTVSELKSQVFAAIQAFNQSVPAEEQLRQIAARQEPGMIPQAQKLEVEQHLQQLIIRYSALTTAE